MNKYVFLFLINSLILSPISYSGKYSELTGAHLAIDKVKCKSDALYVISKGVCLPHLKFSEDDEYLVQLAFFELTEPALIPELEKMIHLERINTKAYIVFVKKEENGFLHLTDGTILKDSNTLYSYFPDKDDYSILYLDQYKNRWMLCNGFMHIEVDIINKEDSNFKVSPIAGKSVYILNKKDGCSATRN